MKLLKYSMFRRGWGREFHILAPFRWRDRYVLKYVLIGPGNVEAVGRSCPRATRGNFMGSSEQVLNVNWSIIVNGFMDK